jgi:parallel beta-helix repeat protein
MWLPTRIKKIKGANYIRKQAIIMVVIIIFILTICGTVSAANRDVGPGYAYTNITDAINAASPGDNINVHDNNGSNYTYTENVAINKANLSIVAKGNVTVKAKDQVHPYVFLIGANGVTISGFSNITGAKNFEIQTASGICVDANNSIIINNTLSDNFLGINVGGNAYSSMISGNTIIYNVYSGIDLMGDHFTTISGNTIENNMEGITTYSYYPGKNSDHLKITGNKIRNNQNQGILITIGGYEFISTNGTNISGNTITGNKRGIQIDCSNNNLIENNVIQNNTYGIYLFGSSNNTISKNKITGNAIGIYVNKYTGDYSDIIFLSSNNTITGNDISGNNAGLSFWSSASTGNKVKYNRIVGNSGFGLANYSGEVIDARENWWGSNSNPSSKIYGNAIYDSWIVLQLYKVSSGIVADLTHNSNGVVITGGHVPDGIKVSFTTTRGILSPRITATVNGKATSKLLRTWSTQPGIANVSAKVDNQTKTIQVTIEPIVMAINVQNLKPRTVHLIYYVKITGPDGKTVYKRISKTLRPGKSAYIKLGNIPDGAKITITAYVFNKSTYKKVRSVKVVNKLYFGNKKYTQIIQYPNVPRSLGKVYKYPSYNITEFKLINGVIKAKTLVKTRLMKY